MAGLFDKSVYVNNQGFANSMLPALGMINNYLREKATSKVMGEELTQSIDSINNAESKEDINNIIQENTKKIYSNTYLNQEDKIRLDNQMKQAAQSQIGVIEENTMKSEAANQMEVLREINKGHKFVVGDRLVDSEEIFGKVKDSNLDPRVATKMLETYYSKPATYGESVSDSGLTTGYTDPLTKKAYGVESGNIIESANGTFRDMNKNQTLDPGEELSPAAIEKYNLYKKQKEAERINALKTNAYLSSSNNSKNHLSTKLDDYVVKDKDGIPRVVSLLTVTGFDPTTGAPYIKRYKQKDDGTMEEVFGAVRTSYSADTKQEGVTPQDKEFMKGMSPESLKNFTKLAKEKIPDTTPLIGGFQEPDWVDDMEEVTENYTAKNKKIDISDAMRLFESASIMKDGKIKPRPEIENDVALSKMYYSLARYIQITGALSKSEKPPAETPKPTLTPTPTPKPEASGSSTLYPGPVSSVGADIINQTMNKITPITQTQKEELENSPMITDFHIEVAKESLANFKYQ